MNLRNTELVSLLSPERIEPYLLASSGDLDRAMGLYERNQALSEALYIPLQNLEVGLRNRLHTLFCKHFGSLWFRGGLLRKAYQIHSIEEACRKLESMRKPLLPGRVVAEMHFGFWTGFFDSAYDQPLWHQHLREVFPGAPQTQPLHRKLFSERLQGIRHLRNRIFHHEPILRWTQLSQTYADIALILEFLSHDLALWNFEHDRFRALLPEASYPCLPNACTSTSRRPSR